MLMREVSTNLLQRLPRSLYYRPPTKLREGNVFKGVCQSVHGGSAPPPGTMPPRTVRSLGPYPLSWDHTPPWDHTPLNHTPLDHTHLEPQKRVVHIPLERFLVP